MPVNRIAVGPVSVCLCWRMSAYLLVLCLALLQQRGGCRPEPLGCQSPDTVRVAEDALEQINQDRTNGYILSLNRVYDISHTPEKVRVNSHIHMHVQENRKCLCRILKDSRVLA